MKRSHLPTMSQTEIKDERARFAYLLSILDNKIPDIRAILKCSGPYEVRSLIARGERIAKGASK